MQRRASPFPIFFLFLILGIIVFSLAKTGAFTGLMGFFESGTVPIQRLTFGLFNSEGKQSEEDKLKEENRNLLTQLAKQKDLEKENQALHDQFQAEKLSPQQLLPTNIIGRNDDQFVIDKGSDDGVTTQQVIVFKDNLVGKVIKVSAHRSVVHFVTHPQESFTAQTSKTNTLGVITGRGGTGFIFGNVVLSDKLEKDDLVVTRGDVDENGKGFPPDLVVGKITAVYKQPSALFQAAEVKSLVNFDKLSTVFILTGN